MNDEQKVDLFDAIDEQTCAITDAIRKIEKFADGNGEITELLNRMRSLICSFILCKDSSREMDYAK